MRSLIVVRIVFGMLFIALAGLGCSKPDERDVGVELKGMGATFPAPLYQRWTMKYAAKSGVKIRYQAVGSSAGVQSIMVDNVDFAASDTPLSDDEMTQLGDAMHIPTTIGAVAIIYNLPGEPKGLKLTPEVLANIYLGNIKNWNDPALTGLNGGLDLPDLPIVVVARKDGSGTSKVLTEYLSRTVPAWKEKVGSYRQPKWPTGLVAKGSQGLSTFVKQKKGAIGYVALNFAKVDKHRFAEIKNRTGTFVAPSLDSMTAAAAGAVKDTPEDLRALIVDADGEDAYPLTSFTYIVVRKEVADARKGGALARFLWWAVHKGQNYGPRLNYATLPPEVVDRVEVKLKSMHNAGTTFLKD